MKQIQHLAVLAIALALTLGPASAQHGGNRKNRSQLVKSNSRLLPNDTHHNPPRPKRPAAPPHRDPHLPPPGGGSGTGTHVVGGPLPPKGYAPNYRSNSGSRRRHHNLQ